jgi:transcriptional regulator with XRE-family HTH domain
VADLGDFLRARRARVRPADVGLPAGTGRRRTAGLRREELAALAGISIDYYIRLEQGKETHPSPEVLDALASALLLDGEERRHLHELARRARRQPPGPVRRRPAPVSPGIRQLLARVRPCPAYVLTPISDVVAANPEGLALFAGLADWPVHRRNTARYVFLHPMARELVVDWSRSAASTVANLRAVAADPDTPGLAALIDELIAESPDFARLWQRHDVRRRRGEAKRFRHPRVGEITLTYEVLHIGDEGLRMSLYQAAPDSPDEDALRLLAMVAGEEAGSFT